MNMCAGANSSAETVSRTDPRRMPLSRNTADGRTVMKTKPKGSNHSINTHLTVLCSLCHQQEPVDRSGDGALLLQDLPGL